MKYALELSTHSGEHLKAGADFTKARELSGGNSEAISMTGYAWALEGEAVHARNVIEELEQLSTQRHVPANSMAVVYSALGENDQAFDWLEKAYRERDVRLTFLKTDPKWDLLRTDARFAEILKRVGLG